MARTCRGCAGKAEPCAAQGATRGVLAHLCGVRGSCPAVGADFAGVGGNTSCVALQHDGEAAPRLILDAGTGIRRVTELWQGRAFDGTILFGHLHWDHTQGLPFFQAADRPDARTRVLIPAQGEEPLVLFERFMSPPAFPVGPSGLDGSWTFASLEEGEHHIEGFDVLAREIPHKGGRTFGYRITDRSGCLAYLSDHGPYTAFGPGPDGLGPLHEAALSLCANADVVIHDAQHTAAELPRCASYGHSAIEYAVALAERAGAARVLLFHHDPGRTDEELDELERAVTRSGAAVTVTVAREGARVRVGG